MHWIKQDVTAIAKDNATAPIRVMGNPKVLATNIPAARLASVEATYAAVFIAASFPPNFSNRVSTTAPVKAWVAPKMAPPGKPIRGNKKRPASPPVRALKPTVQAWVIKGDIVTFV
jgi:hypothetical protein